MSQDAPSRPQVSTSRANIAIVASLYNETYVQALLDSVREELDELLPQAQVMTYRVPGAFEIPVCAEFVLRNTEPDAVIALGVILRGETEHGDLVGASVTDALQRMAVAHCTPIVHEVLLLDNEEQAKVRCFGDRLNRGTEAGRVAVNMVQLFEKLRLTFPFSQSSK
ncbi:MULTISPECIES: 6,7-dimethyl-8-ribityllumazine synthase [unclassified Verrucomicrobium]|jgi:6,7-dimethyl-8-ribityllumazine synthase|uniref:6,7-dimethyl-8-ribityllumazine synthase n=1 Tax=unclassified Verrucomicrobium TaxID=2625155 RepID=UPI00056F855E|nr:MULTISPECIES: 6,7-dimethyl-8-ribityllumazine synthase [unclassified Verrucomicrobium]